MEKEIIDIKVDKIIGGIFNERFDCEFYFINNSKEDISLLMGFPVQYGYMEDSSGTISIDGNDVTDFEVVVDRSPVKFEKYIHGFNSELKEIEGYDEVYSFNVSFEPESTKIVRIRYNLTVTQNFMGYVPIRYILKSARTWNLPIKNAGITISYSFPVRLPHYNFADKPDRIAITTIPNLKIELEYNNYSPQNDFHYSILERKIFPENSCELLANTGYDRISRLPYDKDLYFDYELFYNEILNKMPPQDIARLMWAIPASHGYTGEGYIKSYLENYFYNTNYYSPSPEFRIEMLSEEERIFFDALGETRLPSSINYDFNKRLKKLINEYQKQQNAVLIEDIIYFLKKCEMNNLTSRIDTGLIQKAKTLVTSFIKSGFNSNNLKAIGSFIRLAANLPIQLRDITVYDAIEKAKAREKELEKRSYLDKKNIMNDISTLLKENEGDGTLIRQALVLISNANNLHHSILYDKKDNQFVEIYTGVVKGYYESLFNNPDNLDFFSSTGFRDLKIFLGAYYKGLPFSYFRLLNTITKQIQASHNMEITRKLLAVLNNTESANSTEERDIIRKAYYIIGNTFFLNKAYSDTIDAYKKSFALARSNPDKLIKPNMLYLKDISGWQHEGETEAPCYYIAYNIACSYSMLSKLTESLDWLDIAFRLKPGLRELARKDKDLDNLRNGIMHEVYESRMRGE